MNKCDCPFQITFQITCPCHLLDWLIWLFIAGFLITGRILVVSSGFYFYTDKNNQPVKISTIRDLELWRDYSRFLTMICGLSDKMKDSILRGLRMDYFFMFFAYGALYLLARWVAHCFVQNDYWPVIWLNARWLPLIAWVMDISENIFTAMVLRNISKTKARIQRVASALKWLLVMIYITIWIVYIIKLVALL
jgi:hypothetical protein